MKNFTLKLCLIFTILSICATSFADVTFKFKTPSDWSKCHIWAWDDDNTQLASTTDWPGDAAMTLGSDGYYTYTLKTSVTKVNFLFNNGASSGTKQRQSIFHRADIFRHLERTVLRCGQYRCGTYPSFA